MLDVQGQINGIRKEVRDFSSRLGKTLSTLQSMIVAYPPKETKDAAEKLLDDLDATIRDELRHLRELNRDIVRLLREKELSDVTDDDIAEIRRRTQGVVEPPRVGDIIGPDSYTVLTAVCEYREAQQRHRDLTREAKDALDRLKRIQSEQSRAYDRSAEKYKAMLAVIRQETPLEDV